MAFFNVPRIKYEAMAFFKAPRIVKGFPANKVSHIQQIETLKTRLENARKILAADRVFPGLNTEDHFVVFAPEENGYYIVNAKGCCPDEERGIS